MSEPKGLVAKGREIGICDHVYIKGLKKGTQCTDFGRYNGKCCKHKPKEEPTGMKYKTAKVRAAENTEKLRDDEIFNEDVRDAVPEETAPQKSSVWTFTINSNTDYDKMTKSEKLKFKRFMKYVFDEESIFDFITDLQSPEDSRQNIDAAGVDYYFENSSKNLLHAHGILRIKHRGHLRLELNKIRALAREIFGKNIHIDAPVGSDYIGSWENYMKKNGIAGKISLDD